MRQVGQARRSRRDVAFLIRLIHPNFERSQASVLPRRGGGSVQSIVCLCAALSALVRNGTQVISVLGHHDIAGKQMCLNGDLPVAVVSLTSLLILISVPVIAPVLLNQLP